MQSEIVARGGAVVWEFDGAAGGSPPPPPPPPGPKLFTELHARGVGRLSETQSFTTASAPAPAADTDFHPVGRHKRKRDRVSRTLDRGDVVARNNAYQFWLEFTLLQVAASGALDD